MVILPSPSISSTAHAYTIVLLAYTLAPRVCTLVIFICMVILDVLTFLRKFSPAIMFALCYTEELISRGEGGGEANYCYYTDSFFHLGQTGL